MSREWLTVIIVLLIVTVVLDGLRRMRNGRRSAIKMSRNVNRVDTAGADTPEYGSELPNGGARVVNVRQDKETQHLNKEIVKKAKQQKRVGKSTQRIPQQVALNLDEHVPMLMDSIDEESKAAEPSKKARQTETPSQPSTSTRNTVKAGNRRDVSIDDESDGRIEPSFGDVDSADAVDEPVVAQSSSRVEQFAVDDDHVENTSPQEPIAADIEDAEEQPEDYPEPDMVLVINVMARKGQYFMGPALLKNVLDRGLRYGSMNIFHHHAKPNGEGEVLYSLANIVMPGTFDLNSIEEFYTPGISLFMTLPLSSNSQKAFDEMVTTAKTIATVMGGELKDENRSVLTPQTIEHYKSRIKEYERKQLSKAPA